MKNLFKHYAALLLAAVMLIGMLPLNAFAAEKAEPAPVRAAVTTGVDGLSANSSGDASWSSSGGVITGSVTASSSSGCTGTTYTARTGSLTFTNNSGSPAQLSFCYNLTLAGGSAAINDTAITSSSSFTATLEAGGTVTVSITSNGENSTAATITISNLALTAEQDITVTFQTPDIGGSYTYAYGENAAVTAAGQDVVVKTTDTITLTATPATNYVFRDWCIVNGSEYELIGANATLTTSFTHNTVVTARFIPKNTALFLVGSTTFTDLNEANAYAGTQNDKRIILLTNGTLPAGNYTIGTGRTLLIPFDEGNTLYTSTPEVVYNVHATPTAYRLLTMAANAHITVENGGAISVGSKLSSKGQMAGWNGTPTGPGGRIKMNAGSTITLNNGANLYCWGYIYGSGSVEALSGATVYEAFQIKDWRGGTATSNVSDYAFIFNQYYIQNIEVSLKINAGASEKLYSAVNALSSAYPMGATLIGQGGLFSVTSGYIIKDYIEAEDRLKIDVNGDAAINPMTLTGLPMIGSISTSDFIMPITSNMTINFLGGTTTVSQDIEILPGVELNVARGANFNVSSGKSVYLYDNDDWLNFTGKARLYVIGYSVANGTKAIRTAASLKDVKFDVNGVVNINGSLYTSTNGADITSSLGTEGNNGRIVFGKAPTAAATIYEMLDNSTKTEVSFTAPQLHNGADYSDTTGTGTSTWYYDKSGEHWYRYIVDFVYNGATVQRSYICEQGDTAEYDMSGIAGATAAITSGTASISTEENTVTVSNVTADTVVTITGSAASAVTVHHYLKGTTDKVAEDVVEQVTGNTYTLAAASEFLPEFDGYALTAINAGDTVTVNGSAEYAVYYTLPLTITAANGEWVYDGSSHTAETVSVTAGALRNGDALVAHASGSVTNVSDTRNGNNPVAAGYAVTRNGAEVEYYVVTTVSGTLTITPKSVTVAANNSGKVYGETDPALTADVTGLIGDDTVAYTLSRAEGEAAGEYAITASGAAAQGNYAVSFVNGTFTISPKAITVTANNANKTYGDADPAFTATVEGLLDDAAITYRLTREEGENVGEYAISATGPAVQGNYAVTYVPGVFTITRATAVVTADDKTWAYHGENDEPELTASVAGLVNGDSEDVISYTVVREPGNEPGTYVITPGGSPVQGNYNVTYRTGTLTIVLAEYTVTWKNWNGVILEIDENVPYGTIPRYNGQIPEKEETEQCTYSFMGWSPMVTAITGDTEYAAVFRPEPKTYTVTWMNEGAAIEVDASVPYGSTPQYNGETPVKQGDAQYTYTFIGWNDGTETYLTGQTLPPVHGNTVFTAVYSTNTNKYTVEWMVNGETVETDTNVPYGTMPEYNGATPEKEGNAQYSYRFTGWSPEVTVVTGNAVYTAVFEEILNTYTVTWIGHDGQILETDVRVPYGTTPEYNGNTPQKPSTPQYSYSFAGWAPEVVPVTGNAEYTAVFTENTRTYTVTWKNWNGVVLETDAEVPYGDMPEYNGQTPERASNAQFSYIFNGWEPDLAEVTDDAVYIASFLFVTNTYTVTWKNWDGEVLETVPGIPYGDMPVYSGPVPERPADAQYTYVFTGWYPTVVSVTGDAVYTAQYGTIVNRYTISFIGYNNAEVASYTVDYGTAVSVPAAPEVEGHTFVEWKCGDTVYPTGSTVTAVEDLTIQAEYSVNTYTVTYKVNGIAVESLTVRYGDPIPASSFVAPEGCRLGEWGEIPETMPAHDVTVEAEMTTTITYEANGGEGDAVDRTVLWMVEDVLENALFEREGFTFAGWNTEADGSGSAYGGGAAVTPAGPMTLYAQWSERTFTITWNNYDGSKLGETVVAYGTMPVYEGEDPEKPGNEQYTYSFMGWTPAIVPAHEDTTYTAVFSASVNTYEIRFVNYNGALLASYQVPYGEIPVYDGPVPEEPSTDEFSYSFAGWEPAIASVTGDAEYRAVFTTATNTYTVTWYNWDGTELEKDEDVAYGTLPTYDGETPERAADAQYTYEFTGWAPAVSTVTGNTAYTAVYSTTVNEYTVRFLDYNGAELAVYTLAYGTTPEYNGPAPERAATAQYTYSFAGWSPEIAEVTGDVDYTAVYSSTVNTYSVVFLNDDGSLLEKLTLEYGTLPAYTGETPQKAPTAQYSYVFTGWTPAITEVTGNTEYKAVYSASVNSYPITWYGWNGEVIDTTIVEYGTLPAYDAPERPADAQYTYTFTGWTPEIVEVTGAAAYTATYLATVNTYTVTWVNWNSTVIETDENVPYGETPEYNGETPLRTSDDVYDYTFSGWAPEIAPVTGNATYTAQYTFTERVYTLTIKADLTSPAASDRMFLFAVANESGTTLLTIPVTVGEGRQTASVNILGLGCGVYTVTELTGWSWDYEIGSGETAARTVVINSLSDTYTAEFGNSRKTIPWLHGEVTKEFA